MKIGEKAKTLAKNTSTLVTEKTNQVAVYLFIYVQKSQFVQKIVTKTKNAFKKNDEKENGTNKVAVLDNEHVINENEFPETINSHSNNTGQNIENFFVNNNTNVKKEDFKSAEDDNAYPTFNELHIEQKGDNSHYPYYQFVVYK